MTILSCIKNIFPYGIVEYFLSKKRKKKAERLEIPESFEPPLYNEEGSRMHTFYLKDEMYRDQPYSFVAGRYPKYIHWDRYNYGLKTHFYSHRYITEPSGKPDRKFAYLIESESIVPHHYTFVEKNPVLSSEFVRIFTHSAKILEKYPNAAFLPGGGVWYGTQRAGGCIDSRNWELKEKNISIVSSAKNACELHAYRINAARHFRQTNLVDTYGTFDGGTAIKIADTLTKYRYSIAIENCLSPYWFTEKILNCFAAMTVPIYIGASQISNFFNPDGIIQIDPMDFTSLDDIVRQCTANDYNSRLSAIIDNFNRVQKYLCIEDYLFTEYKDILL